MDDPSDLPYAKLNRLISTRAGEFVSRAVPAKLYHYTTSASFLGIIKSGKLWFTDYKHLNDLSELNYGIRLFEAELTRLEDQADDRKRRDLLAAMRKKIVEYAQVYTDAFVFSLCAADNLLNQWRVYGRDSVAISIEFDAAAFLEPRWYPHRFYTIPLIYDRSAQERIVCAVVEAGIEWANEPGHESDDLEYFASECVDRCLTMKHPDFSVEQEWRLVTRWGAEHRTFAGFDHRVSPRGIVPYLVIGPEDGRLLPLTGVTIGPCDRPQIQRAVIYNLLWVQGYGSVRVTTSDLPVRM